MPSGPQPIQPYDVAVVGAGFAGINALAVASQYLTRDQRMLLIDRRDRVGGMWVDTYPYVRLHQPHSFFTAGDIKWTLGADRAHLATKSEVLDHFLHCVDVVGGRVRLDQWLGTELISHEADNGTVRLVCRSADGKTRLTETTRLVKAPGFTIETNEPLEVSSERIHSVSPDFCDVRGGEMAGSSAPVWVIGGGKTAMDTAYALIKTYPGREVNMLAGSGTFFLSRDKFFPTGARRWSRGTRNLPVYLEWARRFDGTNGHEVMAWVRDTHCITTSDDARNFFFATLSESEGQTIRYGVTHMVKDHLVDAEDRNGGVELVLRSGDRRRIDPGSWLVNCTGYVFKKRWPYEPYMSANGNVAVATPRSYVVPLSSLNSYFLAHLMMLGTLADLPLYALDLEELYQRSRETCACAAVALLLYNLSVITDNAPRGVFIRNGLDMDRWFPLPRYSFGILQWLRTHRREREHVRRTLDTVRERFDVRCGPIV